jgi:aspartate dehydrogenase
LINVGIVGAGAIGSFLLRGLVGTEGFKVVALAEIDESRAKDVLGKCGLPTSLHMPLNSFPADTDVFVEAASQAVATEVARFALGRGKIAIIASIGGLGDLDDYKALADKTGGKLILPSGALVGLDALKAIPPESITVVVLMSSKPAKTLADAKYVVEKGLDLNSITEPTLVFEGSARLAAAAFPKSANVAAALAHASIGLDNVHVEMWADPESDRNRHTIRVESGHGVFVAGVSNVPFEENPRTSKLAAYSILATVRGLSKSIIVGT